MNYYVRSNEIHYRQKKCIVLDSKEAGGLQLCHVYDTLNTIHPPPSNLSYGERAEKTKKVLMGDGAQQAKLPASGSNDTLETKVHVLTFVLPNFVPLGRRGVRWQLLGWQVPS